jgi:hypothetical protein
MIVETNNNNIDPNIGIGLFQQWIVPSTGRRSNSKVAKEDKSKDAP